MTGAIRILAFTDPHNDLGAAQSILRLAAAHKPDLVICAGDVSYFGQGYGEFMRRLSDLGQTVYWIPGNHEPEGVVQVMTRAYSFMRDISYMPVHVAGIRMIGLPGNDTDFWPDLREDPGVVDHVLAFATEGSASDPLVLVTHYAPSGTRCDGIRRDSSERPVGLPQGDAGGNRSIRTIVERLAPCLVLCGHYHACFGMRDSIGPSVVLNPGPNGLVIQVSEKDVEVVRG